MMDITIVSNRTLGHDPETLQQTVLWHSKALSHSTEVIAYDEEVISRSAEVIAYSTQATSFI